MPSNFSSLAVDWYDATDSYVTTIDITEHVKSLPMFTDTGTGEVNEAVIILKSLNGRFITAADWVTSTAYKIGDRVKESSKFYLCLVAHTSGTFATDLSASKWTQEPDIDVHDRFRIRVTDTGSNTYDRFFEMLSQIPSGSKTEGYILTLNLLGIEYHTQHIHMARPYYFEDGFTTASDIGKFYNENKGTDQPIISELNTAWDNTKGNDLPTFTANNYEYGLVEDFCYNRWMDVIEKLGSSVSAGGTLQFFELSFTSTGVNALDLRLRQTGDNTPTVTIKNAKITNPMSVSEQEGELLNPTGLQVWAWGSNEHGSLPVGFSKYDSNIMFFFFRPKWVTSTLYKVDALVRVTTSGIAKHYKCLVEHTSGTFATDLAAAKWVIWDMSDQFGDSEQYTPWTDDKATLWGNNVEPDRASYTAGGWFDINVVIQDDSDVAGWFRTWVNARAKTDAALDLLADNGASNEGYSYQIGEKERFPNGFRVLVDGTGTGNLSGFDNQVVEYRRTAPTTYTWSTLYDLGDTTGSTNPADVKIQIAVLNEGKIYDGAAFDSTPTWTAVDTADYGNDSFHPYTTLPANADGVDTVRITGTTHIRADVTDSTNRPDITHDGGTFAKNKSTAVKFVSAATAIDDGLPSTWSLLTDYYKSGVGFNIVFPFPFNNFNSIDERVGALYGGGFNTTGNGGTNDVWTGSTSYTRGDIVVSSVQNAWFIALEDHTSDGSDIQVDITAGRMKSYFPEPSVMDIQNMNYTHDGKTGFNWGGSSEDLGPINAVAMWLKVSVLTAASIEWDGEHKMRAWFMDTKDNVVAQDFVIDHSNNWQDIRLPIPGFKPYRGRKPAYGFDAIITTFVAPKDLEILNIFEWRNVKMFGVQMQGNYDENGRYNPIDAIINSDDPKVTWSDLTGATHTLWLDGFRFIKPLLTSSGEEKTRNIEPEFLQRSNITLYHQLQNDAKSQLEIEKFKHKAFTVETTGDNIFDIDFGDSFFLLNPDIISDSDNSTNNNIQLVAKRIEYSITKPPTGKGGLRRRINGSKVFV